MLANRKVCFSDSFFSRWFQWRVKFESTDFTVFSLLTSHFWWNWWNLSVPVPSMCIPKPCLFAFGDFHFRKENKLSCWLLCGCLRTKFLKKTEMMMAATELDCVVPAGMIGHQTVTLVWKSQFLCSLLRQMLKISIPNKLWCAVETCWFVEAHSHSCLSLHSSCSGEWEYFTDFVLQERFKCCLVQTL